MAVKIRLRRMGRKKQPHYRIVVADSDSPRDGRFVESLGYYRPLSHPARLVLDLERVDHWLGQGAQPSNTVKSLIHKARKGGDSQVAVGTEDHEARKRQRSEELAERRAAEKKAAAAAAEAEKAAAAAKKAEAEQQAAAEAAEAEEAEEAEGAAPALGDEEAEEAEAAPEAEEEEKET